METLRQLLPLLGPWLLVGLGLVLWLRYWPLRLQLTSDDAWPARNASPEAIARAGELLTALMHAQEGWQELRLQPASDASIAKIFVRSRLGPNLYEVRLVETRCTSHAERDTNVATAQLGADSLAPLTSNEPTAANAFTGIVAQAVKWNSARVEKFLYLHALSDSTTRIYPVTPNGRVISRRVAVVSGDAHESMCRLLLLELPNDALEPTTRIDHRGKHLRQLDIAA